MNYIKYLLSFIKELIFNNKIKFIFIVIACVLFYYAGTIPDSIVSNRIVKEIQIDNETYLYIRSGVQNNQINYDIIQSDKPQKVTNGILLTSEYHGGNVALWVLFGIISLILFIFTLVTWGESEGWEIEECLEESFLSLVECEFEGDKYYYTCCGKLLGVSDHKRRHQYILGDFSVRGFDELKTCPKFETKTQRRDRSLKELGI
jgi:hypothetical protein